MTTTRDVLLDIAKSINYLSKRMRRLEKMTYQPIRYACRVYNSTNFTHDSTGNWMAITFDSERWDSQYMHSVDSNTSRITFPVTGWYLVGGTYQIDNNGTGVRAIAVRLGGTTDIAEVVPPSSSASVDMVLSISTLYYFTAADYVELMAYQNSGGSLDIKSLGNYTPEFWAIKWM